MHPVKNIIISQKEIADFRFSIHLLLMKWSKSYNDSNSMSVKKANYVIGIDEVGRGPLAGPVTVAAVAVSKNFQFSISNFQKPLRDSKKLSAKQREEWYRWIKIQKSKFKNQKLFYSIASCYPKTIDRINITQAANLAASRALEKLVGMLDVRSEMKILMDGGLYINHPTSHISPRTIKKGDEKYNCIMLASIVAKVKRDRIMKRNHKKFPQYGFDEHFGYGTKKHMAALKKYGFSTIHRLSF